MPPKSSQKSQTLKSKPTSALKVKSLSGLPESHARLDPLTAFSKVKQSQPPSRKPLSQSLSQSRNATPTPPHSVTQRSAPDIKGKSKQIPSSGTTPLTSSKSIDLHELWVDIFRPTNEESLAVHARKVEDVRRWLSEGFTGGPSGKLSKYRRILALTGPAGSGKTSTIDVLSREMDFEILEWRNSMSPGYSDQLDYDYESPIVQFEQFIERGANCSTVFESSNSSSTLKKNHVILLEDLPNIIHFGTRERFHSILQALVNTPPSSPPVPVVIILSDSGVRPSDMADGRGWGREEVVDVRMALPRDLLKGPYVTQIAFNPIAPTLLKKALLALPMQAPNADPALITKIKDLTSSKQVLDMLVQTSGGDIRSAIMSLQFACIIDSSDADVSNSEQEQILPKRRKPYKTSGNAIIISSDSESEAEVVRPIKKRRKDAKKIKPKKNNAKVVLEALTRREHALVLFHLIGKILWNKRRYDPPPPKATQKDIAKEASIDATLKPEPTLPSWLQHEKRRTSRVDVNALAADSPIDSSLLSLYIHQNYTSYCEDIDECGALSEILSIEDSLAGPNSWQNPTGVAFHLLVMGTHHGLPSPVVRRGQKVFKPDFFDVISKEKEAWEGVRDVRTWLAEKAPDGTVSTGVHWTRSEIAIELGGVLKARDSQVPRTHRLFSNLVFSTGDSNGQILDEEDGDVTMFAGGFADDEVGIGGFSLGPEDDTGWLDSDDITEF